MSASHKPVTDAFEMQWAMGNGQWAAGDTRQALIDNRLFFALQPIINSRTSTIIGFEALLRCHDPHGLNVPTNLFIHHITDILQDRDCRNLFYAMQKNLYDTFAAYPGIYLSFNMDIETFKDDEFFYFLGSCLPCDQSFSTKVVIELTETPALRDVDLISISKTLQDLRSLGVKIALDDFGRKSSNFFRFMNLPVDMVKIDQSIVSRLDFCDKSRKILESLSNLFTNLGVDIVAEGVETKGQAQFVSEQKIFSHQGFLYSRPLMASQALVLLK